MARDYDELRFRTDNNFNNLIRSMDDHAQCFVADIEEAFQSMSPDSIIGHNLIMEHLHPNSRGNFLIACIYAKVMREHGLLGTEQEWRAADTLDESRLWEDRCVTELDERIAQMNTAVLTSGWPFENKLPTSPSVPTTDTLGQIAEKVVTNKMDWKTAHEESINFYDRRGDLADAEKEYKTLLSEFPLDIGTYMSLARLYLREKRLNDMEMVLLRSVEMSPSIQAYRTLGDIMMQRGDALAAVKFYEKTDNFFQEPKEKLENAMAISYACVKAGKLQEARNRLTEILALNPDYKPAAQLLHLVDANLEAKPEN